MLKKSNFCFAIILCLLTKVAFSQVNNVLPEEIVISGGNLPYQLRRQIFAAEENLYNLFNELNDEKRFKITCSTNNQINSHISKRTCLPAFHRDAQSIQGQNYLAIYRTGIITKESTELDPGNAPSPLSPPTQMAIKSQQDDLKIKMQEIASQNPVFLEALIKYVELKSKYAAVTSNN